MLASYESRRSKMYLILRETKLLQSTTKLSLIEPLLRATDCFYLRKGTFKNMSTLTDGILPKGRLTAYKDFDLPS